MNNRHNIMTLIVASLLAGAGCTRQVSFSQDVNPILSAKCLKCHDGSGEGSEKSGFNVKSYDSLLTGTKLGQVIVPGDALSSSLYLMISHKANPEIHMPPHGKDSLAKGRGEPLSQGEIDTVKRWIDQGAKNN
jgi:hypothetical protein